ncbi:hypothetical protein HG530_006605 [Fusarium avenaceum]|nr:hypothetical protein HG530_006605 [Fusarium avenaceum]
MTDQEEYRQSNENPKIPPPVRVDKSVGDANVSRTVDKGLASQRALHIAYRRVGWDRIVTLAAGKETGAGELATNEFIEGQALKDVENGVDPSEAAIDGHCEEDDCSRGQRLRKCCGDGSDKPEHIRHGDGQNRIHKKEEEERPRFSAEVAHEVESGVDDEVAEQKSPGSPEVERKLTADGKSERRLRPLGLRFLNCSRCLEAFRVFAPNGILSFELMNLVQQQLAMFALFPGLIKLFRTSRWSLAFPVRPHIVSNSSVHGVRNAKHGHDHIASVNGVLMFELLLDLARAACPSGEVECFTDSKLREMIVRFRRVYGFASVSGPNLICRQPLVIENRVAVDLEPVGLARNSLEKCRTARARWSKNTDHLPTINHALDISQDVNAVRLLFSNQM